MLVRGDAEQTDYLFSPRFEGEKFTEFEKFLLNYRETYPNDVAQIVYRLDIIKRDGAEDRHLIKNAGETKNNNSKRHKITWATVFRYRNR